MSKQPKTSNDNTSEIEAKVGYLEEMMVDKDAQIASLEAEVTRLSKATAKAPKGKASYQPKRVKVDGTTYLITTPALQVQKAGKLVKMTADELAKDEEVLLDLIKFKSGALQPG